MEDEEAINKLKQGLGAAAILSSIFSPNLYGHPPERQEQKSSLTKPEQSKRRKKNKAARKARKRNRK